MIPEKRELIDIINDSTLNLSPNIKRILTNLPQNFKFEILNYVDRGCWSVVFSAKNKNDGSYWALKLPDFSSIAQKQYIERELDETSFWHKSSLNGHNTSHANLAFNFVDSIELNYDDGSSEVVKFLAEEYIDRFLDDYIDEVGILKTSETLKIAKQISNGIYQAHKFAEVSLLDIHLGNIGYSTNEIIKLSDFGTSTNLNYDHKNFSRGLFYISSPENLLNLGPGEKSDVWSFGSVLYKLITGKYLFEEKGTTSEDLKKFYSGLNKKSFNSLINKKVKKVPPLFRNILFNSLNYDSNKRWDFEILQKEVNNLNSNYFKRLVVNPLIIGGVITLLTFSSLFTYHLFNKKIQNLTEHVKQIESQYPVKVEWDENICEIKNNLFTPYISISKIGKSYTTLYPENNYVEINSNEEIFVNINLNQIAGAKSNFGALPTLNCGFYIEGYDVYNFVVDVEGLDNSDDWSNYGSYNYFNFKIPDIPAGNYSLILEAYAPSKNDANFNYDDDILEKIILRKSIPLLVNEPSANIKLTSANIDTYNNYVHFGNPSGNLNFIKPNLTYEAEITDVNFKQISQREINSNSYYFNLNLPNDLVIDNYAILQFVIKDDDNIIGFTFLPIEREFINSKPYWYVLSIPDKDYANKIKECRMGIDKNR